MTYPYKQIKVNGRRIDEHRWIMEQHLGRKLGRFELVHHINHDKRDNRIENLAVMGPQEHSAHHNQKHPTTKTCQVCGSEFTPHPTKRKRAKTCGKACRYELVSMSNRKPSGSRSMYRDDAAPSEVASRRKSPRSS